MGSSPAQSLDLQERCQLVRNAIVASKYLGRLHSGVELTDRVHGLCFGKQPRKGSSEGPAGGRISVGSRT
jgi:hypothetical protein